MLRRLSTLLSAISILLCLSTCALWARSYWYLSFWDARRIWNADAQAVIDESTVISFHGWLYWGHASRSTKNAKAIQGLFPGYRNMRSDAKAPNWQSQALTNAFKMKTFGGFGYERTKLVKAGPMEMNEHGRGIIIPFGAVALMFAAAPAGWFFSLRRARRAKWRLRHQRCFRCGYDLRASSGQCPECGVAAIN